MVRKVYATKVEEMDGSSGESKAVWSRDGREESTAAAEEGTGGRRARRRPVCGAGGRECG